MFAVLGQRWRTHLSECSENSDKTGVSPRTPAPHLGAGEGGPGEKKLQGTPLAWVLCDAKRYYGAGTGARMSGCDEGRYVWRRSWGLARSQLTSFCLALKMYCLVKERKRAMCITGLQCQNCFLNSVKHEDSDSLTPCPLGSEVSPGR